MAKGSRGHRVGHQVHHRRSAHRRLVDHLKHLLRPDNSEVHSARAGQLHVARVGQNRPAGPQPRRDPLLGGARVVIEDGCDQVGERVVLLVSVVLSFAEGLHDDGDEARHHHDVHKDHVRPEQERPHEGVVLEQVLEVDCAQQHCDESIRGVADGRKVVDRGAKRHVEGDDVGHEEDDEEEHEPQELHRCSRHSARQHPQLGRQVEELEHGRQHHEHVDREDELKLIRVFGDVVQGRVIVRMIVPGEQFVQFELEENTLDLHEARQP
mmetsp:Transcript_12668/g.31606  ORF Transcript_12668/g.31606 Transcript_12668/m.31606 type:complete len:267 (+) Transcript_12668:192-992(+)